MSNETKVSGEGVVSWLIIKNLELVNVNIIAWITSVWLLAFQTHTQAERKVAEAKREALLKEASENVALRSSLSDQLAALDLIKPHPYGTFQAVNSASHFILSSAFLKTYLFTIAYATPTPITETDFFLQAGQ